MITSIFEKQVYLLLSVLDDVLRDPRIALKGGTALNLFIQNMPRLSVDIDLTYLPLKPRNEALSDIELIFDDVRTSLTKKANISVQSKKDKDGFSKQLVVRRDSTQIKIEINPVLRGSVYASEVRELCSRAQEKFQFYTEANLLSFDDLYAGKFVAALDRQHPRDLFDVKMFFDAYTFTEKLKKAFLVYLISHDRPIHEVIKPNFKDIRDLYSNEFEGMVEEHISLKELETTREKLIETILSSLTENDKEFLISFKKLTPNWDLLGLPNTNKMPAVQWKLLNLSKMSDEKRDQYIDNLRAKLNR
ncbi:MAG: nucleotidyl transferase AbiEii/AbiGii toxin family protein [Candidatus Nucleicultricaceae bacterium]